jgi:hypothetical protein
MLRVSFAENVSVGKSQAWDCFCVSECGDVASGLFLRLSVGLSWDKL